MQSASKKIAGYEVYLTGKTVLVFLDGQGVARRFHDVKSACRVYSKLDGLKAVLRFVRMNRPQPKIM